MVVAPTDLLWALIGLLLTIGGTLLEAFTTNLPWSWGNDGIHAYSLGVSYQVGAVLLIGCLGGKNAATLSQIAYLALGIIWFQVFGFQVFDQGGGIGYIREPTFGYLLGFVPAAWVCGDLAFRARPKLETLAFSGLCGLLVIHITGLSYLVLAALFGLTPLPLFQAILAYSVYRLPGQLAVTCAVTVLAFFMRHLMFY
ncbi:MAG: biotin transporter BioY [Cyanothece sp. SIO1E1]|nr:biotin transporter BioY [Cyanothece sp. SIO1E1]